MDDAAVIARVLAGDTEAYSEVVRAWQTDVWRVVTVLLRDGRATEDLVQQVFVNAYDHLGRFDRSRPFGPWIKQIARNLVKEELRRRSRERNRLRVYHDRIEDRDADPAAAEARADEMSAALRACREGLAGEAARAVALRYQDGLEFGAIASALGRTEAACRQMLVRIRLALRDCIEKKLAQA